MAKMAEPIRILLADDDETFRRSTADLLRQQGYACDDVRTAQEARHRLATARYDVFICDIRMPGNAELELLDWLAARPDLAQATILITGFPSLQVAIRSIDLSMTDYLVKPFEFARLVEAVRAVVAKSRGASPS